jgi:hypothetical protein
MNKGVILTITTLSILGLLTPFSVFAFNPDAEKDTDGDGLSDYEEKAIYQTFWDDADTDNDGYLDGEEIQHGYSPWQGNATRLIDADTDGDGLNDAWEIRLGSNLLVADSDGDGYTDFEEVVNGYMPVGSQEPVEKKIIADLNEFTLAYYHNDIELDSFSISSGRSGWETPRGEFEVLNKVDIKHYFGYPNTPFNLEFTFNKGWKVYIHQAYWHANFGVKNVSTGCINVPVGHMQRLYEWATVGTKVIVR